MKILNLDVDVPKHFSVQRTHASDECTCLDAKGGGADALAASIRRLAVDDGFRTVRSEPGRVVLERGEQRLLLLYDDQWLTIQATDESLLERAKHEGSVIFLGDLRADLGTASIEPLRARHGKGAHSRSASWIVGGSEPATLVARVIDQVVAERGLTRGALFEPPINGIQCWTGEAYSKAELVKVRATLEAGKVTLQVNFVESGRSGTLPG